MKRFLQVVLPLIALMLLVGGVTFVAQYKPQRSPEATGPRLVHDEEWLEFHDRRLGADPEEPVPPEEWAVHGVGRHDFEGLNRHPRAFELTLRYRSCACARILVAVVDEAAWTTYQQRLAGCGLVMGWTGAAGQPELLGALALAELSSQVSWQELDLENHRAAVVPANAGQAVRAWISVRGQFTEPGPQRVAFELLQRRSDGVTRNWRGEVPVLIGPAVRSYPEVLDLGSWNTADVARPARLWLWSATQDWFSVQALPFPGLEVRSERLTPDEVHTLEETLRGAEIQTKVRHGYTITVQPRSAELDLGPLTGRLRFATEALAEPLSVRLKGHLAGDVTVGTAEQPNRIQLGSFRSDRGVRQVVPLTTNQADLRLEVEKTVPAYLTATLQAQDGRRWQLTVEVPPERATGPLPPESVVLVKVQGEPPRRLRIPVSGQAVR